VDNGGPLSSSGHLRLSERPHQPRRELQPRPPTSKKTRPCSTRPVATAKHNREGTHALRRPAAERRRTRAHGASDSLLPKEPLVPAVDTRDETSSPRDAGGQIDHQHHASLRPEAAAATTRPPEASRDYPLRSCPAHSAHQSRRSRSQAVWWQLLPPAVTAASTPRLQGATGKSSTRDQTRTPGLAPTTEAPSVQNGHSGGEFPTTAQAFVRGPRVPCPCPPNSDPLASKRRPAPPPFSRHPSWSERRPPRKAPRQQSGRTPRQPPHCRPVMVENLSTTSPAKQHHRQIAVVPAPARQAQMELATPRSWPRSAPVYSRTSAGSLARSPLHRLSRHPDRRRVDDGALERARPAAINRR
jgi:hypothetical protein